MTIAVSENYPQNENNYIAFVASQVLTGPRRHYIIPQKRVEVAGFAYSLLCVYQDVVELLCVSSRAKSFPSWFVNLDLNSNMTGVLLHQCPWKDKYWRSGHGRLLS